MQPPQPPGPYGSPPFPPGPPPPGPFGAPGGPGGPGPFPPPPRKSRAPLVIIGVVAVLVVVGIGAFVAMRGSGDKGRFRADPAACSLITPQQVKEYLPGAAPGSVQDTYYCSWSSNQGEAIVSVEVIDGSPPERAREQYQVRRRQADDPGVTITPQALGDEAFMACRPPDEIGNRRCQIYVRVSNAVFSVEFVKHAVPGGPDAGSSAQALAAAAVQHLRQAS